MHMLSSHNRSEFLATPQLIRFDYCGSQSGFEPTLLIKGSTLLLKYIVRGARMQLAFGMCEGRLLYALKVFDDGEDGGTLWSIVEHENELKGFRGLARGEPLVAFLFNELALNVAWHYLPTEGKLDRLASWANTATLGRVNHDVVEKKFMSMPNQLYTADAQDSGWLVLEVERKSNWKAVKNNFITAGASSSLIHLFEGDEGNQQEQLGLWLTDSILPFGVHHSPQIPKGTGTRELTDILLSYEFGSVLIESKTLSVFTREQLPSRSKLKRDVSAQIGKAFGQLRGALKKLKSGVPVTSLNGVPISIEREKQAHAIVLIPDFELVDDPTFWGFKFMQDFMASTGGLAHLLDTSELLRIVQAAELISARGKTTTPMMAFDYYLLERAKKAAEADTLCIEVLLRFEEEDSGSSS
jgi:hypothetical protein